MNAIIPILAAIFALASALACLGLILRISSRSGIPIPSFLLSSKQLKSLARIMTTEADPIDRFLGIVMACAFLLMIGMITLHYW